ncbi:MAG TPA: metal-dependent hydrolase [Amycolatopsis sp.]|nr:metal-dependent hydrolase [Amycolatopsis sp.]
MRERLPWRWLALGCLLPDVIDKPIWLVAQWLGAESRHFDTARMVGHTAFVAAAVVLVAWRRRSPAWTALAYGIPTHLVLDVVTDYGMGGGWGVWKSWLFWPFHIPRLGILMIPPMQELAFEMQNRVYIAGELIGAALLLWDFAKSRLRRDPPRRES